MINLERIKLPKWIKKEHDKHSFLKDVGSGYIYAYRHRELFWIMNALLITSICARPYVELLAGYAGSALSGGSDTLAVLTSSNGIGAIFAGLWLGRRKKDWNFLYIAIGGGVVACCGMVASTMTGSILACAFFSAMIGFGLLLNGIGSLSLLQIAVNDDKRGRVLSLYYTLFRGGLSGGAAIIGLASDRFGIVTAFEGAGMVGLMGCTIIAMIIFHQTK